MASDRRDKTHPVGVRTIHGAEDVLRRKPLPRNRGDGAVPRNRGNEVMCDRGTALTQNTPEPRNRLLAGLPPRALCHLRPHLEPVALLRGEVLFDAGEALTHAYFIEAGVVALVAVFENGTSVVSAIVGREGLVGVGALLGNDAALGRHLVQVAGSALTMEAARFRDALRASPSLRTICQAYVRAFLGQVLQTIACHNVHTLEEKCARSLLVIHDRSNGDTLALRQEFLAEVLGVRRSTAAAVTRTLQRAGLISYCQGDITVLDRAGLESAACECYGVDRERYRRLLPDAFA
jgi:CRP-like cAMP-binding protein